jgi:hypothetical protein
MDRIKISRSLKLKFEGKRSIGQPQFSQIPEEMKKKYERVDKNVGMK